MSKMVLAFTQEQLPCCCGVDEVGNFEFTDEEDGWSEGKVQRSKTGLLIATFNDLQRKEMRAFKRKINVLYAPRGRRSSTGKLVYLVVGEYKEPKVKK